MIIILIVVCYLILLLKLTYFKWTKLWLHHYKCVINRNIFTWHTSYNIIYFTNQGLEPSIVIIFHFINKGAYQICLPWLVYYCGDPNTCICLLHMCLNILKILCSLKAVFWIKHELYCNCTDVFSKLSNWV